MGQPIQRITIVHPWHDDNRGDCAILMGMLTALWQRWPEAEIRLISSFDKDDPAFVQGYRHTLNAFPALAIVPMPCWGYSTIKRHSVLRQAGTVLSGLRALLSLVIPTMGPWRVLDQTDLIIMAGGNAQPVSQNRFKSLYLIFRTFYFLFLARRRNIPYLLFSRSFELTGLKINNEKIDAATLNKRLDGRLLRFILSRAMAVWARENLSLQTLISLGIPEANLSLVADSVFYLEPGVDVKNVLLPHGIHADAYWVITVKQCASVTETFLREMTTFIQKVLELGKAGQVLLVAQSIGPTTVEDDRYMHHQLAPYLQQKGLMHSQVMTIEDDLSPAQLSALYGGAKFVVGMRLQSVILALVAGTPVYAIAYTYPKTHGIMAMMDMEHLCTSIENFSATAALAQIDAVDMDGCRQKISHQVQAMRQGIDDALKHIEIV